MGYLEDHCVFYKMTPDLVSKCGEVSCSLDPAIDEFFREEYYLYEKAYMCVTYCFVNRDEKKIVAAFALSMSSITVRDMENRNRRSIEKGIPYAKHKSQYPALLLGQLAVFDGYRGHNIGREILDFVKALFAEPYSPSFEINYGFNNVGCCYILVDALNKEKVLQLYTDNGFQPVFVDDEEPEGEKDAPQTKALLFNLARLQV